MIGECLQNLDAAAHEKNLHKDEKLPSIKKKIYRNDKTEYWPKIIVESLNWLHLLGIMGVTADRIENYKNLLPSLLNFFTMFKIK